MSTLSVGQPGEDSLSQQIDQLILLLQTTQPGLWVDLALTTSLIRLDGASNTWVWVSDARNHVSYFLVGNTMFYSFYVNITTTIATAMSTIYLALPPGYRCVDQSLSARQEFVRVYASDGGGQIDTARALVGSPDPAVTGVPLSDSYFVKVLRGGGNYTAGATIVAGQLFFEVSVLGEAV